MSPYVAIAVVVASSIICAPWVGAAQQTSVTPKFNPKTCPKVSTVDVGLSVKVTKFSRTIQYFTASGGGKYSDNDCTYITAGTIRGYPVGIEMEFQNPTNLKSVTSLRGGMTPPVVNFPQLGKNAIGSAKEHLLEMIIDDTWIVFQAQLTPMSKMVAFSKSKF
jgi:hypothetical protein